MVFSNEFDGPGIRSILTRFSSYLRHWQSQRAPQMDPISPSPFIHPVSHSHPSFISLTHSHPVIHTVTHLSQNHPVWICFKMDIFDNMSSTAKLTDNLNCFFRTLSLTVGGWGSRVLNFLVKIFNVYMAYLTILKYIIFFMTFWKTFGVQNL